MTNQATTINKPDMRTIRQVAQDKILPERALRRLVAQGKIKTVRSGKTQYINYTSLIEQLNSGEGEIWQ
ncbi:hypothetical protein FACS1894111_10260 [Clostridia bacterium]|nr:hypothetical protein FACS1894111_10260 [Clostridia bacterium]